MRVLSQGHNDWLLDNVVSIKDLFSYLVIYFILNNVTHSGIAQVIVDFATGLNTVHNRHVNVKQDHIVVTFRRLLNFLQSLQAIDCRVYLSKILLQY